MNIPDQIQSAAAQHANALPARAPSWYSASLQCDPVYPQLEQDLQVDVAIVGGGLTGVAAAVELAEKGLSVVLLEARRIGWGATGRNGGQVTGSLSGDSAMLKQWTRTMGNAAADYVWQLRWRGHTVIRSRIEKYAIDCDLKSGHLHAAFKPSHCAELESMYREACSRGMQDDVKLLDRDGVREYIGTDIYHGGLYNSRNLHLHSLKLCLGEAAAAVQAGAQIYEGTEVLAIDHGQTPVLVTDTGRVSANSVLLAGNAYHRLERKQLGGMLFPASLANLTTEPLPADIIQAINPRDLAVYDTRFVLDYYRITSDNRLMFGGGSNYSGRDPTDIAAALRPAIEHTFTPLKGVRIDYEWTGKAGITINRIPQLGRLSEHVFYAQGYSGHGIATSHIAAQVMANAIAGSREELERFEQLNHIRIPLGDKPGQWLLTLGMLYYRMLEWVR